MQRIYFRNLYSRSFEFVPNLSGAFSRTVKVLRRILKLLPAMRRGVVDDVPTALINSWSPVSAIISSKIRCLLTAGIVSRNKAILVCNSLHRYVHVLRETRANLGCNGTVRRCTCSCCCSFIVGAGMKKRFVSSVHFILSLREPAQVVTTVCYETVAEERAMLGSGYGF